MSTEAEIVEFEGRRYRVAGKSGPGVEPKVGMVLKYQYLTAPQSITKIGNDGCLYFDNGCYASRGESGAWEKSWYKILAPLDASPPAETPRCEAPEWCGLPLLDRRVPGGTYFYTCGRASEKVPCGGHPCPCNSYCSPACADRARAAAPRTSNRPSGEAPKRGIDEVAVGVESPANDGANDPCKGQTGDPSPGDSSASPASVAHPAPPIPPGYRLAKGWKVLETPGRRGGGTWRCWSKEFDCPKRSYETLFASDMETGKGACLDCAERRGAIERVEDRQGLEALAGEVREKLREIGARPSAPCLSHHPELGSRCEAPPGPHDMHIGRRPGTAERCEWWDALAPAETRAERWRRTHPGYQRLPDKEAASAMTVIDDYGRTDGADMIEERRPATKPAPWTPSDPDGDIPNVWE